MKCKCTPSMIAKILVIVGGINWGLVGLGMLMGKGMGWNVVNMVLGTMPTLEGIVYLLVGISAIMMMFGCKCKKCSEACGTCGVGQKTEGSM